jgi:hypothetical protein
MNGFVDVVVVVVVEGSLLRGDAVVVVGGVV